jgi:hypothetical protein
MHAPPPFDGSTTSHCKVVAMIAAMSYPCFLLYWPSLLLERRRISAAQVSPRKCKPKLTNFAAWNENPKVVYYEQRAVPGDVARRAVIHEPMT